MFWFKHANTRKHISEKSWLSGWTILNTLAHLAHLAQFYFSLIFSAINAYNYFWFVLTNKKKFIDWRQRHGKKWPMLTTFFLTATLLVVIVVFVVVAFASFGLREAQIFTRKRTKHFDDCDFRASGGPVEKMFNEIARNKLKKWLF